MNSEETPETTQKRIRGYGPRRKRGNSPKLKPLNASSINQVMIVIACTYILTTLFNFYVAITGYSGVLFGSSPERVRYVLGEPVAESIASPGTKMWRFERPPITVGLAPGGSGAFSVRCDRTEKLGLSSCPAALGLKIGSSEGEVIAALGSPSSESIIGGKKAITYDEVGHQFILERLEVVSIRAYDRKPSFGTLLKYIVWAIP